MNGRRLFPAFFMIACLALLAFAAIPRSAPAQEDLEARVAELEEEVAEQGDDITNLRGRIRDLEQAIESNDDREENDEPDSDPENDRGSNGTTLTGTGEAVSDPIQLNAGAYRISATVDVENEFGFDGFSVTAFADGEYLDLIFNEFIEKAGPWEGSQVLQVESSASIYFEISNTNSSWTLTIEPL